MNERIKLLAEQAFFDESTSLPSTKMYTFSEHKMKKFAKLIVRECLDQCYYRGMNDELYAGQLKAAAYIEEHFGVEE